MIYFCLGYGENIRDCLENLKNAIAHSRSSKPLENSKLFHQREIEQMQ